MAMLYRNLMKNFEISLIQENFYLLGKSFLY